jgi:hypothetical protein
MRRARTKPWWLIGAAVAVVGIGAFLWSTRTAPPPAAESGPALTEPAARRPAHPIAPLPAEAPLPPLESSDAAALDLVGAANGDPRWRDLLFLDNVVRRWVITIDVLPRERLAQRMSSARPVAGSLAVEGDGETLTLSPANYARYEAYVAVAEKIDPKTLVGAYRKLYPLFQQGYVDLVRPDGYFNDRLVEVLDHLLAAPEFPQSVSLVQPSVMYRFADPELEAMSVGHKALVRMGPDNARRVKAVLERVRAELIAASTTP